MKPNLNKYDIEFLIDCLKTGKEIPAEYKYAIFPTKQKEYELVYAGKVRKEDILADNEEAKAVPLQVEKIFNGTKYSLAAKDWYNLLVFGDNLQILKTFYKNDDPLIKGKVKSKVKLIYIDPPFATEDDFRGNGGAKAYSDKAKGAEFVEFLRRRLIIAKEILADDGTIWVHLDYRKAEYIKVLMDEIFPSCHLNTIYWRSQVARGAKVNAEFLPKSCQQILVYKKRVDAKPFWEAPKREIFLTEDEIKQEGGYKQDENRNYFRTSDPGSYSFKSLLEFYNQGKIYVSYGGKVIVDKKNKQIKTTKGKIGIKYYAENLGGGKYKIVRSIDNIWTDIPGLGTVPSEDTGYPTQKVEALLERIINSTTQVGDLVMDFFSGSGTTIAVAEKLGRRWIGCDIGKLAIYTTQKRLLEIGESKDLNNSKKKYSKLSKSFGVVISGLYDLGKVFALKKDEYIEFVKRLFEVEETKVKSIGGVLLDGKRRDFYVKIFPYWEVQNASVDEKYLNELHKNLGAKIDGRVYIIVPANNVHFISDYHEIGGTRYYFLKVPYQIIKELHKVQFKKLRQPQSKKQINDLDEAIGFHFVRQPEVKSEVKAAKDKVVLKIKKFESAYAQDELGEKLENFESLAMVLVDLKYNGDQFLMSKYFFAQDLIGKKNDEEQDDEQIRNELEKRKEIVLDFERKKCGKQMMAIYVDIYGNEFREVFNLK
ncbi:site-specific DNA-methyltransferase [Candidatus Microgenomates bacterium]|nr:MAG: site-specific DNA-methyltransferase [Candidatus Microgenomates bacterium]